MTTSEYDELVKRLGRLADVIDNGGAVDFPDWASVREAADAITRLSRDLASARAAGAEEMREAAAGVFDAMAADFDRLAYRKKDGEPFNGPALQADHFKRMATRIRALPLPSPVAVQAVPDDDDRILVGPFFDGRATVCILDTAINRSCIAAAWPIIKNLSNEEIKRLSLPSPTAGE